MEAKNLRILFKKVKELAKSQDLKYINLVLEHFDFAVYYVAEKENMGYTGYPMYIKVSFDEGAKFITHDQYWELRDIYRKDLEQS